MQCEERNSKIITINLPGIWGHTPEGSCRFVSINFLFLNMVVVVFFGLSCWVNKQSTYMSAGLSLWFLFCVQFLMVQSVFNEHQFMFINFHLFSVDQCVSLIFHESYSYLMIFCANMSDIKIIKRIFSYNFGMEILMVQSVFNEHQ